MGLFLVMFAWYYKGHELTLARVPGAAYYSVILLNKNLYSQDPLLRRMGGCESVPLTSIIPSTIPSSKISSWMKNYKFAAKKIDVLSRVCFPSCFLVFSCLYWTWYLSREQDSKK